MSNRFDSDEYLTAWKDRGQYPAIHGPLWQLFNEESKATSCLDLCCSTGLFGTRILNVLGLPCVGVEGHADTVSKAQAVGVPLTVYVLKVEPSTLPELDRIVRKHHVDTVIARRCFPELLAGSGKAADESFAESLATTLAVAGVRQIFHQGRQVSARSANSPVPDVYAEARLMSLSGDFRSTSVRGECGLLELCR